MSKIPIEELATFNSLKDIKVVFDVGARTDMDYLQLKPEIEIHYFEPHSEFAVQLKGGIVNNFGLSDQDGMGTYYKETQSFIAPGGDVVQYPLKTLDQYAKDIPRIDFLKIDAELMDYKILVGGKETLKKTRYVQFEWSVNVQRFVDLLEDFRLFLMIEPRLLSVIKRFTQEKKYNRRLVPLTKDVVNLLDYNIIPTHSGGNILGKRK